MKGEIKQAVGGPVARVQGNDRPGTRSVFEGTEYQSHVAQGVHIEGYWI